MKTISSDTVIMIKDDAGAETAFNFHSFVTWAIESQPQFNKTASGIRCSMRIDLAKTTTEADGKTLYSYTITEDDLKTLQASIEEPEGGFPVSRPRALSPFLEAVFG